MSIACPSCKAVLATRELKPGKYQPKCLKCAEPFVLEVKWVVSSVPKSAAPPPDPEATLPPDPEPEAPKAPVVKSPGSPARAPSVPAPRSPKPAKPKLDPEEIAARMLAGEDVSHLLAAADSDEAAGADPGATGDFTQPDSGTERLPDPNATGDFTEVETPAAPAPAPPKPAPSVSAKAPAKKSGTHPVPAAKPSAKADPNATGDFTEAEAPVKSPAAHAPASPKTASKPAVKNTVVTVRPATKPAAKADPNATGDFTEAEAPGTPRKADPGATGDFTEVVNRDPGATGDFTEASEGAAPRKAADKTQARGEDDFSVDASPAAPPEAEVAPLDDDLPPRLGGYEVLGVLGKGGMGAVLLGRQISLDRKVALKVMHPRIATNPGFVARFTREAYAAAQLTHHNVIQIYDIGEERGQHFFSMELVAGKSLMDLVKKEGKLTPEVAVGYILQAARGLRYGHNQGMVHRDMKPDNLMLNTEGIVKVADLGLVKLPGGELPVQAGSIPAEEDGDAGNSNLTRAGAVMGTPAYMPPEQATDSASVDVRADIYSLGCTLYVLLTGKPPFEGKTAMEIITKHKMEPITPPEVVVKKIPKALSAIIMKMVAKKPEDRYQTMDEVIAALEGFLNRGAVYTPREEQAEELEKFAHQFNYRSREKLKRSLSLGFFAACLLGIIGAAAAGSFTLAGGLFGLAIMTPIAYLVTHGVLSGSVVFNRIRALVFGMRFFDWVMWVGGTALFLATLYLFGLLWAWLGFAALAAGLGGLLWFLTDRTQAKAQEQPLEGARKLFKTFRLNGMEEDALRQFVCKFSGTHWEAFFEALFGYEAKLAARAWRKTALAGEESTTHAAWREAVVAWVDARLEQRRLAREQKHLQKVEAKALEAEGVNKAEAKLQAEAMAAELVEQAAEVKKAKKEGKEANVKAMAVAARERRKPKPGYNIAGVKLRSQWFKHFMNDWFGRRLRFMLGAAIFAVGLLWLHQNNLLKDNKLFAAAQSGDIGAAQSAASDAGQAATKPLSLSFIPAEFTRPFNSFAVPLTGLILMASGLLYFGWKPSIVAVPGAVVGVLGPTFGVPELGPLSPGMVSLAIGAVLILVVGRFLRE